MIKKINKNFKNFKIIIFIILIMSMLSSSLNAVPKKALSTPHNRDSYTTIKHWRYGYEENEFSIFLETYGLNKGHSFGHFLPYNYYKDSNVNISFSNAINIINTRIILPKQSNDTLNHSSYNYLIWRIRKPFNIEKLLRAIKIDFKTKPNFFGNIAPIRIATHSPNIPNNTNKNNTWFYLGAINIPKPNEFYTDVKLYEDKDENGNFKNEIKRNYNGYANYETHKDKIYIEYYVRNPNKFVFEDVRFSINNFTKGISHYAVGKNENERMKILYDNTEKFAHYNSPEGWLSNASFIDKKYLYGEIGYFTKGPKFHIKGEIDLSGFEEGELHNEIRFESFLYHVRTSFIYYENLLTINPNHYNGEYIEIKAPGVDLEFTPAPYHKKKKYVYEHDEYYKKVDFYSDLRTVLKINSKLSFDANGGIDAPEPSIVQRATKASKPTKNPSKKGYEFIGWYEDNSHNAAKHDFEKPLKSNKTIYARWGSKKYRENESIIEFVTKEINDSTMLKGEKSISQQGKNGLKITKYTDHYENDALVKTTTESFIKVKPIDKIIYIGTKIEETKKDEVKETIIPFKTITKYDNKMLKGEKFILQNGKNGSITTKHIKHYENGKLVNTSTGSVTRVEPIHKVIYIGTKIEETKKDEVKETIIPFKTITKYNNKMLKGEKFILQNGKNGSITTKHIKHYENGKLVNTSTGSVTRVEPIDKIIYIGTKPIENKNNKEIIEDINTNKTTDNNSHKKDKKHEKENDIKETIEKAKPKKIKTFRHIKIPRLNKSNHFAYVVGYPDFSFRADSYITRAEVTTMFARLLLKGMDKKVDYQNSFNDIDNNAWYSNTIGFMKKMEIILGYENGSFKPDNLITRAEFTAIASRFDELKKTSNIKFNDLPDNHWASKPINMSATRGWVNGYPDNSFKPENYITRSEAVTIINRMLGRVADIDFINLNIKNLILFNDLDVKHWAYYDIVEASNTHNYNKNLDGTKNWTNIAE